MPTLIIIFDQNFNANDVDITVVEPSVLFSSRGLLRIIHQILLEVKIVIFRPHILQMGDENHDL